MGHTQGPCYAEEGTPYVRKDWNGKSVVLAKVYSPEWHENALCGSHEAYANACLYAAADDMQKALMEATLRLQSLGQDVSQQEAALAKAAGGS